MYILHNTKNMLFYSFEDYYTDTLTKATKYATVEQAQESATTLNTCERKYHWEVVHEYEYI